jgi:predicted GNAT family N-acyltransferase
VVGFKTALLHSSHCRSDFKCGISLLDDYLKFQASQDVKKRLSACFVCVDKEFNEKVIAYYTLSNSSISRDFVPLEWQRKFPKSYKTIPTTLLGRLAVDTSFHGKGLGGELLVEALYRSCLASKEIGSVAVVVDPIDDNAEQFYASYGFQKLPDSGKLFLAMKTIAQLFV